MVLPKTQVIEGSVCRRNVLKKKKKLHSGIYLNSYEINYQAEFVFSYLTDSLMNIQRHSHNHELCKSMYIWNAL